MHKVNIDVDIHSSLHLEGITTDVYFNDQDSPSASEIVDWETLADDLYSIHCLNSGPLVHDIGDDGIKDILSTVETMRDALDRLEQRVFESEIFLRDKWVLEGEQQHAEAKETCTVSYSEYINHLYSIGEI